MNIIDENNNIKYAIKLPNGQFVGTWRFSSQFLAESALASLPEDQKAGAIVVPVTNEGKEILLG